MGLQVETGSRLIASTIDSIAEQSPHKSWASIPIDNEDLSKGFRDISYKDFANAINHASWWLKDQFHGETAPFETIAYAGPGDLLYPILAVAAVKCGKKILLPSRVENIEPQLYLLRATSCTTYLFSEMVQQQVSPILARCNGVRGLKTPHLDDWLSTAVALTFPYTKSWDEAKLDPWIILQTSGTTGLPKPVIYTNWMMAQFDAAELMPDFDRETMNDLIRNKRCYTPMPGSTYVGITPALQWTVFLGATYVIGPPSMPTPTLMTQVLEYSNVDRAVMVPKMITSLCHHSKNSLDRLRTLKHIWFAGAPMDKATAAQLVGHTKLAPGMGTTEQGAYFLEVRNEDDDWEYYRFRPSIGAVMEHREGNLYELVFHRRPELARWQQIFYLYPDKDRFETKDMWIKHPFKPDLYRYAGRTDDIVELSIGQGLQVTDLEAEIQKFPGIRTALIGGHGKPFPFLLIDLESHNAGVTGGKDERQEKLAEIWPFIEKANKISSERSKYASIESGNVLFTDPARPLPKTAKDTISRPRSFVLYKEDVEMLYEKRLW